MMLLLSVLQDIKEMKAAMMIMMLACLICLDWISKLTSFEKRVYEENQFRYKV